MLDSVRLSHARRGMAGSNGTSPKRRRHQRKPAVCIGLRARRGVARCRPIGRYRTTVELSRSTASVQQQRLIEERLRCHHVQLNVVEISMGRKEQRERERKKAAKGSHALSGFGFLPKKRSWSDGDLNATATSQRQLVEEDSAIVPPATRTRRGKLFLVVFIDSSEC